jgi:hypothetical protein
VFAGDVRVWKAAAVVGVPLLALIAFYCLRPRDYYTGTNSVEALTYVAPAKPGKQLCISGLLIPQGTRRIQLQVISQTRDRPALRMRLQLAGRVQESALAPERVGAGRVSNAAFDVGAIGRGTAERPATACVRGAGEVNWGGTPLPAPPPSNAPTLAGAPLPAQVAVWYLPRSGAYSSYVARAASILGRAALFRPGFVGPWLYWLILLVILPAAALLGLRLLAIAAAHRAKPIEPRRFALTLFVLAAVNFACWAMITPVFQAPDEVDHFAYTQTLAERGEQPSSSPGSPLARWSRSEALLLEDDGFTTDHQVGDTRAPWDPRLQTRYEAAVSQQRPSASDGGGYETASTHGPIYYAALAPAYLIASGSPLSQLTLMRLTSALIGALTVLFAFLLGRELAPRRPELGVMAALLVAFQPMYGFISGAVNNDVGVNAATAALELLVILVLRRGWRLRLVLPLGIVLLALPAIKETGLAIYPAVGLALLAALWRHHRRADLARIGALALAAAVTRALLSWFKDGLRPALSATAAGAATGATAVSSISEAKAHPLGYLAYLWEVFLPRLSFMAPHFETSGPPAFLIFVERGWGAFGWYVVLFPKWVFYAVFATMLAVTVTAVPAAWRERLWLRANWPEAGFVLLCPIAVVAGVEAAFYTTGVRPLVAEFGRYAFPAIVPFALIVVGATHAFGRRGVLWLGTGLVTATIALSFAGQLLTLTRFYA